MLKQVNKCVIFSSFRSTLTHCFKCLIFMLHKNIQLYIMIMVNKQL